MEDHGNRYTDRAAWRASDHPKAVHRRQVQDYFRASQTLGDPGPGAVAVDDGHVGKLHMKSVPHVATGRILRALAALHDEIHTVEGLYEFDAARRTLVEKGIAIQVMVAELRRRGVPDGDCGVCYRSTV